MEKTVKIGFQVGRWNDAIWVLFLTFFKKNFKATIFNYTKNLTK